MIIDKVKPYWTNEESQQLAELRKQQEVIMAALQKKREKGNHPEPALLDQWQNLENEANALTATVETRYTKERSKKAIMTDFEEIVSAIEKTDFLDYIKQRVMGIAAQEAEGESEEILSLLRKYATANFENCFRFILLFTNVQAFALKDDPAALVKLNAIIEKRVSLWYAKPRPAYIPLAHGKATDALAFMSTRNAQVDQITGNAIIDKLGVQLVILKLKELQTTLGISTDKLLSTAIAQFTKQNDFRRTKKTDPRREVSIDLKEYAQLLGYDVLEHETSTPEEAEREKKRAKAQLDNARKAVKKDLDIIHASTLTWKEPMNGKTGDFARVSLVTFTAIKNGEIRISFSPEIAKYLAERNLITQYPIKLLKLDSRKPTAYYIGRKLAEHYNMDNNQIQGTHNRIGIPSILAVTDLPSYKEVQIKDRGHWAERIKEPLERALDTLTQEGILRDWKYTHAKGVDLTEEEAYNITSYEDFAKLYLLFTPADMVDHAERIQVKQDTRKKEQGTPKQKKRTTANKKKQ